MNFLHSPFTADPEGDHTNRWTAVLVFLSIAPLVVALGVHFYIAYFR